MGGPVCRYGITSLLVALSSLAVTDRALAHGFGQRQDIPLPFWLYLFGINAVVLATFVMIALSFDERRPPHRYPRLNLLRVRPLGAVLSSRPLLSGLRFASVALSLLVVLSGLLGQQSPENNFAPTFVWVVWWVGLGFFTAFVGNIWPLVNPWQVLFEGAEGLFRRLGFKAGLELHRPYPAALGIWPALVLYAAFVWFENVFPTDTTRGGVRGPDRWGLLLFAPLRGRWEALAWRWISRCWVVSPPGPRRRAPAPATWYEHRRARFCSTAERASSSACARPSNRGILRRS